MGRHPSSRIGTPTPPRTQAQKQTPPSKRGGPSEKVIACLFCGRMASLALVLELDADRVSLTNADIGGRHLAGKRERH
jgi:hypothetical protein